MTRWIRRAVDALKVWRESDEACVRRRYRDRIGREPDLDRPLRFNDKVLWMSLFGRDPRWVTCADKHAVREFVAERVGERYLIPMLAVVDDAGAIDFDALPEAFIAKATHASGWNLLVRDRSGFDPRVARRTLARWLEKNYYVGKREWQYRDIPPRIVFESLLTDDRGRIPDDLKLWCFGGGGRDATIVQVDVDRFERHRRAFYDLDWRRLPFSRAYEPAATDVPRPENLDELVDVALRLAEGFPFVRADLYTVGGRVYFGELTFTPDGAMAAFDPDDWDERLGARLTLPVPAGAGGER